MTPKEVAPFVSNEILDLMLGPYSPECRYLKDARIVEARSECEIPTVVGQFQIQKCYYAAGEGPSHFTATEFILCFSQLTYVAFAEMIRRRLRPEMKLEGVEDFKRAQMEKCYIGRIYDVVFKAPIKPTEFSGVFAIERMKSIGKNVFYETKIQFRDRNSGYAEGRCLLTFVRS